MVNLEWTPRLERAFRKLHDRASQHPKPLNAEEQRTSKEVDTLLKHAPECVEMDLVKRVSAILLKHPSGSEDQDTGEDWIHVMVKGSGVYIPKPAPKERSPELERIMDGIKSQVAEKEYQRMISSIDPNSSSSVANSLRQDIRDMQDVKAHTMGIINVLYTGGAVFTAIFMISSHFTRDLGMRVLLSFLGFVLIVACESYLYTRHASASAAGPRGKRTKKIASDVVITTRSFAKEKSS